MITFGGYNESLIITKETYPIHWHPLFTFSSWKILITNFKIGSFKVLTMKIETAEFDTLKPFIYIPEKDFAQVIN